MKVAVLGSSGEIGGKVVEELLSDGVDVRRGLRTGAGAPHFDISDRTGATRLIAWADVVVDATPSWVCNPVVTRALEHVPVVSTGHVAIAGQALHVSCAGALPGVLTGVPLLLPRRDRKVVSRTMISAPLSRSAGPDADSATLCSPPSAWTPIRLLRCSRRPPETGWFPDARFLPTPRTALMKSVFGSHR